MSTTPERAPDPPTRPESGPGVTPAPPAGSTFASTRTRPDSRSAQLPGVAPPSPAQVLEGLRARFELAGELGRGAFGVVWRARERASRREVALKVLHAEDALEPRRLERFRREGEVTAGLAHPGIVKVHAAGDVAGVPWLAYELVVGAETLAQAFWRLQADRAARVGLVRQVAAALAHAHERGVVHRDVKPDNVLVDADGVARLADFGLAAAQGQARITRSGAMMGTPQYMSPEQFEGRRDDVGPSSDVWGAGVMLYQALVAELPFRGATIMELGAAIQSARPRPPRAVDPTVPLALEAICLKALARDPRDRYADGAALAADLEAFEAGRPVSAGSALSALRPRARRVARLGALALLPGVALGAGIVLALAGPSTVARRAHEAPTLTVAAPEDQQVVWEPSLRVRGALAGGTPPVRVTVALEGPAARPRTLDPEQGAFDTTLSLAPGEHVLVVTAQDAEGRTTEVRRAVRRGVGPSWYALLPADRRPPYPLADGLDWGKVPNEYLNVRDGSVLVWVPPGTFRMGDEEKTLEFENAWPAHDVVITRGFFIGKTEVTWAQYRRYAEATRTWLPTSVFEAGDDHPVHSVSWNDARAYCAWAGLRLPTEAEWEYAARGSDARRYPWGGDPPTSRRANLQDEDIYAYTSPVGAFPQGASPFGCLDMVGNLWEWVEDRYALYDGAVATDPTGPDAPNDPRQAGAPEVIDHRVNRGGAWNSTVSYSSTARGDAEPFYRGTAIGFRVARSAR